MTERPLHIKAVIVSLDAIAGHPDAGSLLNYIGAQHLRLGFVSRKKITSMDQALKDAGFNGTADIAVMVTQADRFLDTPDVNGFATAIKKIDFAAGQILAVSAYQDDIRAGLKAGAVTVYLKATFALEVSEPIADYVISNLNELKKIIRLGTELPAGKLPNDFLGEFLEDQVLDDPAILIHPGIGEDTTAVDITSQEVLVLKSDPITFATDSIGQYAVIINANDIATSGAKPRWMLTTLLFPQGATASEIRHVVQELQAFCRRWGISLCGGHTEVTDAVARPLVVGMMAGTVAKSDLIDKRNMRCGDKVLLTKALAVEGTAIIAREFGNRLQQMKMTAGEIKKCRAALAHISVISEATIAAQSEGTSAMHDITEGGLATALEELSIAGGHRIRIDMDKIPLFPATRKICRLLEINPLGLIGSGSLLICSRPQRYEALMSAVQQTGIQITCIGEVLDQGRGIDARRRGMPAAWPRFEVDEITKLFLS